MKKIYYSPSIRVKRSITPSNQIKYYTKNLNENEKNCNKTIQQYIHKKLYEIQKDNSISTKNSSISHTINIKNKSFNNRNDFLKKTFSIIQRKNITSEDIKKLKIENIKLEKELNSVKNEYILLKNKLEFLEKKANINIFQFKTKSIFLNGKPSFLLMNNSNKNSYIYNYNDSINSLSSSEDDIKINQIKNK